MKNLRLLLSLMLFPIFGAAQTIYIGDTAITQTEAFTVSNRYPNDTITIKYCGDSIPISIPTGDSVMVGFSYTTWTSSQFTFWTSSTHNFKSPVANDSSVAIFFDTNAIRTYSNYIHSGMLVVIKFVRYLPTGNICWVTVDSNSQHNVVVWDTTSLSGQNIDTFKIYFYNSSNVWQLLSSRPYIDTAYYLVDTINNPNVSTVRYRILSVNSCGNVEDSAMSPWQNTMWISNSGGIFSWSSTGYLIQKNSTPVLTYVLFRDTTGHGSFDSIGSVSGSQNIIADPNYAKYPNGRWYVGAILNVSGCPVNFMLDKKSKSTINTVSRSNRFVKITTGIQTLNNAEQVKVYPNPFVNSINVDITEHGEIQLLDVTGRQVYYTEVEQGHNIISVNIPDGVYFLKANGNVVQKMVRVSN